MLPQLQMGINRLYLLGEVAAQEGSGAGDAMLQFVKDIAGSITSNISLTQVAAILTAIIGAGIVAMFAWKFGRKGFEFVKNALSGKNGRV